MHRTLDYMHRKLLYYMGGIAVIVLVCLLKLFQWRTNVSISSYVKH